MHRSSQDQITRPGYHAKMDEDWKGEIFGPFCPPKYCDYCSQAQDWAKVFDQIVRGDFHSNISQYIINTGIKLKTSKI